MGWDKQIDENTETVVKCDGCNGTGYIETPSTALSNAFDTRAEVTVNCACSRCMGTGSLIKITKIQYIKYDPNKPKMIARFS